MHVFGFAGGTSVAADRIVTLHPSVTGRSGSEGSVPVGGQVRKACGITFSGSWLRSINVWYTLINIASAASPFSLRLDWLFLRKITAGRIVRSAGLLSDGTSG